MRHSGQGPLLLKSNGRPKAGFNKQLKWEDTGLLTLGGGIQEMTGSGLWASGKPTPCLKRTADILPLPVTDLEERGPGIAGLSDFSRECQI